MREHSPEDRADARRMTPETVEVIRAVRATRCRPSSTSQSWDAFLAAASLGAVEDLGCGCAKITPRGRRLLSAYAAMKRPLR